MNEPSQPRTLSSNDLVLRWFSRMLVLVALSLGGFCVVYTNWDMLLVDGRPSIEGVDDTGYYIWARSLLVDGDLNFENDVTAAPTLHDSVRGLWLRNPRSPSGRVINKYPPGWALAHLPAIGVAHLFAKMSGAPADGWSPPYFVAVWVWSIGLALLGLFWAWKLVSRFADPRIAAVAVLGTWIASPQIYYSAGRAGMTHGLLFTLLAGLFLHAARIRDGQDSTARWFLVGALAALGIVTRATTAVYLAYPALLLSQRWSRLGRDRRIATGIAVGLPLVGGGLLLLVANKLAHGAFWLEPYPGETFDFLHPHLIGILFSSWHGLFYWHPILLVGAIGLAWGMGRRELPRCWALSFMAIWFVNASWWSWSFGSSFGNRAFEGVVLMAMAGLAWLLARTRRGGFGRAAILVAIGFGVVANSVLLVLFLTDRIPRLDPVDYRMMYEAGVRFFDEPTRTDGR